MIKTHKFNLNKIAKFSKIMKTNKNKINNLIKILTYSMMEIKVIYQK